MLDCVTLANRIRMGNQGEPMGLAIIPEPSIDEVEDAGEASVTLRLGRWFVTLRQSSQTFFDVRPETAELRAEASASRCPLIRFSAANIG